METEKLVFMGEYTTPMTLKNLLLLVAVLLLAIMVMILMLLMVPIIIHFYCRRVNIGEISTIKENV